MKIKIAILDWDGTIASGFSLFRYVDFLVSKEIISKENQSSFLKWFDKYNNNEISYLDLCIKSPLTYAESLKGHKHSEIISLIKEFEESEKQYFLPHSIILFEELRNLNIEPIIVSGAPYEYLYQLKDRLNIREIYAQQAEFNNDIGTGKVLRNPSIVSNKEKYINEIKSNSKYDVVLSVGDSTADVPLFIGAPNNIIVNNEELTAEYCAHKHNVYNLSTENFDRNKLIEFLKSI